MRAAALPGAAAGDPSPPPGVVVTGRYDQGPGYGVNRPLGSRSWLFTFTMGGRGLIRQGSARAEAVAGHLVVLAPGVAQRYGVAPGAPHWRFWWAHCQTRPSWTPWLHPYAVADGLYVLAPLPDALRGRVEAAFGRMLAGARRPARGTPSGADPVAVAQDTLARELALCALEEVVLLAASGAGATAPEPDDDARVRRAEELIAADPGAPHTVRSLAESVALSPSRFAHLFALRTGRPPMRALREARLWHAARLLEVTDLTVERVAAASGFPSPFHFSRLFRARYGVPPGAYRAGERP
ncbi:AraC family transcriptional regulator of arabinose operon [Streptomyces griseochromogenes]|uniref:AraC family transcriptional regulator n=1 Tax=Streptomyces griseochromogenes TaxID=68214 RepID=A0A1B1AXB6_9ACTN|nr:helix-turn-helix domain-containing protein [Streptomyces griseochromogenes]ANP51171.1 AraC family transcriptional regulator [Streptomyces griseochromogenes]MBP2050158.1 AraC family transcriptional regulator of arabinose operon [Streptomyces griseochromogenes]